MSKKVTKAKSRKKPASKKAVKTDLDSSTQTQASEKAGKGGRPSKFRPEFVEQVFKLCLLGSTDAQLADFFEVNEDTINEWKKVHPEFSVSLKRGKDEADATVAQKLFHRATGYTHDAVKIFADPKTGAEHVVKYTEHYAPDTTAAIFWLKNRRPNQWREKVETTHSLGEGMENVTIVIKGKDNA